MKIKYITCDGITEVEEEISWIEFWQYDREYNDNIELECQRSKQSKYYKENCEFNNKFYVFVDKVISISE